MNKRIHSSRQGFAEVRQELLEASKPEAKKKRSDRSSWQLIQGFFGLLRGQRKSMAFALGTLTVSTLLALVPPAATKVIVDYVLGDKVLPESVPAWVPREPWPLLLTLTVAVLGISLVKLVVHIWGRWHATRVTKLLQMSVRKRVFAHVMRLPLHRIQELKSGGAASILRQDAGSVGDLVFGLLYNPWRAIIQLVGSLCVLAYVDWRLLLGALFLVPLVYFTHRTWIGQIRPQHRRIRAEREKVDGLATEAFGGMRVVRAFGRQRAETGRIMKGNHLMGRQELYAWWSMRWIEIIWEVLMPLASAALLAYGGWRVLEGALSLGDMVMFLAYLLMLLGPLAVLAQSAATLQNGLSGLDRIVDLLDEPTEEGSGNTQLDAAHVEAQLTLDCVSFSYPGSSDFALRDIELDIQAGETIALVGPSGSGKTTLCNLLARFYEPTSGRIMLDGDDIAALDITSYRNLLSIVDQEVFLFDGTVAENIAYGNRHATDSDIRAAAQLANATEFIDPLPHGYETLIGERGVKLSGGQRQRLAIARAVLADPQILILDEATSNLDTESELTIQSSLAALMDSRTAIVIAHRLSTIAHADRIVVLEAGRIVEIGTHAELIASDGRYRDMVLLQTHPEVQRS
ncbi:MAG: ABC transporter ATP-binding protein [Bythopirellula sp.]